MTEETIDERVARLRADPGPVRWWWLSFSDQTGFLGVALVEAANVVQAATLSHQDGRNPGGEVQAVLLEPFMVIRGEWRARLLDRDEAQAVASDLDQQYREHHSKMN